MAVPHAALSALNVNTDVHVWSPAALAGALHGAGTTITVPVGEFTVNEAGDVVVWDEQAAGALFEALRTDFPAIPPEVLGASARSRAGTGRLV